MNNGVHFLRRSFCRLALTLGIFCFIEVFMSLTEGTRRNFEFPWGHYHESLAILGALLLLAAYATWTRPR